MMKNFVEPSRTSGSWKDLTWFCCEPEIILTWYWRLNQSLCLMFGLVSGSIFPLESKVPGSRSFSSLGGLFVQICVLSLFFFVCVCDLLSWGQKETLDLDWKRPWGFFFHEGLQRETPISFCWKSLFVLKLITGLHAFLQLLCKTTFAFMWPAVMF